MREQLHSSPADIAERSWRRVERIDTRVLALLERFALLLLRLSLGIVFVWFGILKITDQTPWRTRSGHRLLAQPGLVRSAAWRS